MAKETEVSGLVAGDGRHVSTTLTLRRSLKLRRGCSESDGIAAVNRPTSILQLTDDEQHQLSQVAVARLHALDFPCIIVPPPKRRSSSRGGVGGTSAMKKFLRLKRYVRAGHALESVGLWGDFSRHHRHKSHDTAAESNGGGGGKKRVVFGMSLSKCVRLDAERHGERRVLSVSPSSESSLLDALSLQSASTSRLTLTAPPRLSADRLYDEQYCYTLLQVPRVLRTCCLYLKTHGLNTPGIFRIAGSKSRVTTLRQEFDSGASVHLTSEAHSVHDVASLLKEYLRDLPDPLLTHELFPAFLAAAAIEDVNSRVSTLRLLVSLLPTVNRDTLWYLLTFLACVAKHADDQPDHAAGHSVPGNKMDSLNLATVFGPNVLRRSGGNGKSSAGGGRLIDSLDEMSRNSDVVAVVKDLIDFHAAVFRLLENFPPYEQVHSVTRQLNHLKLSVRGRRGKLTKELYDEVLEALTESGTVSCEPDVTTESAYSSQLRVDALADSSEGSFRTSSSGGCDVDCWSSEQATHSSSSSSHHQLNGSAPADVSRRCHSNGEADDGGGAGVGDWQSQRWRHWQQMTLMSNCENSEQLTLV